MTRPRSRAPRKHAPTRGAPHAPVGGTRWTRWIAYGAIGAYALLWAVKGWTLHRLGNYAVETDFYWKYGPAAEGLRSGRVLIEHFDTKGWGYPAVVAALSSLGFKPFQAGQLVALLSACAIAWLAYRIHRSLLGPALALLSLLVLLGNPTFLANTYEVGTDMFFVAVAFASIALLLRSGSPGLKAIAASGLLGGWAFTTRYNGLFLWPGALLCFLLWRRGKGTGFAGWRPAGLYSAAFLLGALPWLWINAAHTGNPLTNNNYMNVGYAVYGEGNWERFFYGRERSIHSFMDVVRLDPVRFAQVMVQNAGEHLVRDLGELLGSAPPTTRARLPAPSLWGWLALLGGVLLALERPGRRVAAYFAFGTLYFITLVPVFYGARFSLALLPFYAALAAYPFVSPKLGRALGSAERLFPIRAFAFLLLWIPGAVGAYAWTEDAGNPEAVQAGPHEILPAVSYLEAHGDGSGLLARKPHAAFLAGMRFVPAPLVGSADSLHAVAQRERARYVLVSAAELGSRAAFAPFVQGAGDVPGFRRVFESPGALVYEVIPDSVAGNRLDLGAPSGTLRR